MALSRTLALVLLALTASSCGRTPRDGSPVGTWVLIDDSTRAAEYVTVSEAQTIRDIEAPGYGAITLRFQSSGDEGPYPPIRSLHYIQGFYIAREGWKSRIVITDSSSISRPTDIYLDVTDPDSVFAVYDYYSPPGVDFEEHTPVRPLTPGSVTRDSAVFQNARFAYRYVYPESSYRPRPVPDIESFITADGSLVFPRRRVDARREVQFGTGNVAGRTSIYSMRFTSDGTVRMYSSAWSNEVTLPSGIRSGRWTRLGPGQIRVDLDDVGITTYRFTVNRVFGTMTVVEDTPCDSTCRAYFAALLDVRPGTLLNVRTEQTRTYRWERNPRADSLPRPAPPAYEI